MPDKTEINRTTKLPEPEPAPERADEAADAPKGAANPDPEPPKLPFWKKTGNKLAMIIGAVVLSIGLAILAVSVLPIQLTKVQVVNDYDAARLTTEELTDSVYASNVGYEIDTREVSSIEDAGRGAKVAHLVITLRNKNFMVYVYADQNYELSGRDWLPKKSQITKMEAVPIAPVDEARVLADMDTLMSKISPKDGVGFSTLYNGADFEVESAELAEDASSCEMKIRASKVSGVNMHTGVITAEFDYVPGGATSDPGSWKLTRVSADDECWQSSLAPLTGTWRSRLDSTETSAVVFDMGKCNAGKEDAFAMEVSEFDVASGKMTADISFVVHAHPALSQDSDRADGDTRVKLEGVTVALDPKDLSGSLESENTEGSKDGPAKWTLEFFNDMGLWRVRVRSSERSNDTLLWGPTTFTDTYTLTRS